MSGVYCRGQGYERCGVGAILWHSYGNPLIGASQSLFVNCTALFCKRCRWRPSRIAPGAMLACDFKPSARNYRESMRQQCQTVPAHQRRDLTGISSANTRHYLFMVCTAGKVSSQLQSESTSGMPFVFSKIYALRFQWRKPVCVGNPIPHSREKSILPIVEVAGSYDSSYRYDPFHHKSREAS